MILPLTANTQAILLLTAPLITGPRNESVDLLTLSEYNRLARTLREKQKQPVDFIGPDSAATIELCSAIFGRERLERLLGRGFLLSQAIDRWHSRATWVISRADPTYPRRLKTASRRMLLPCCTVAESLCSWITEDWPLSVPATWMMS